MKRSMLIAACASLFLGTAIARTLELIEGAYEVRLTDITLPRQPSGTLTVRPCMTCEARSLRLSAETAYVGPDGAMPLQELVDDIGSLRGTTAGDQAAIFVFYRLGTNQVTRVSLHLR